jgi:methyl-accepting chemotaxis protein
MDWSKKGAFFIVNILFRPGLLLLNRLPFGKKFLLLFLIFAFSLASIGSVYIYSLNEKTKLSEREREGLTYIQWQLQMLEGVQTHQELTFLALNGEQGLEPKIKQKERQIAQLVRKIKDYDRRTKLLANDKKWQDLQQSLQQIAQIWTTYTTEETIKRHHIVVTDLLDLMMETADRSHLTLDDDIDNNYLVRVVVDKFAHIAAQIGSVQETAFDIMASGQMREYSKTKLSYLLNGLSDSISSLDSFTSSIFQQQKQARKQLTRSQEVLKEEMLRVSNLVNTRLLTAEEITIDTKSFYEATSPAREKMFAAAGQMVQLLKMRIAEKHEQLNVVKWGTIVVIITVSLAVLYLFAAFYRSVHQHVTLIEEGTLQAAKGDLMVQLHIHTKDEFARIAHSFNSLIRSFRTIISANHRLIEEVSASSQQLTAITEETMQASAQMATAMETISLGTKRQLEYVQENTEAIRSLEQDTYYISERAKEVAAASGHMSEEALRGNEAIQKTVQQMENINQIASDFSHFVRALYDHSRNIEQMTKMITSISEQTHLLSLNAAIEAARAGEHGKGFAVVANEVRKLAEQSSQSAKQIHVLLSKIQQDADRSMKAMDTVLLETEKGVAAVNDTGTIFTKILQSTRDVTGQINEVSSRLTMMEHSLKALVDTVQKTEQIASDSKEQAQTIAAASEQLLASMEEISSSAQSLSGKAQDLYQSVEQFQL